MGLQSPPQRTMIATPLNTTLMVSINLLPTVGLSKIYTDNPLATDNRDRVIREAHYTLLNLNLSPLKIDRLAPQQLALHLTHNITETNLAGSSTLQR